jgi:hypothetical protein
MKTATGYCGISNRALDSYPFKALGDRPNSGPFAALAAHHSRHHEKSVEILCRAPIADVGDHAFVVVDAVLGSDLLVVPAVILENLAATLPERAEIRVCRVELTDSRVNRVRFGKIAIHIEREEIPIRIAERECRQVMIGEPARWLANPINMAHQRLFAFELLGPRRRRRRLPQRRLSGSPNIGIRCSAIRNLG